MFVTRARGRVAFPVAMGEVHRVRTDFQEVRADVVVAFAMAREEVLPFELRLEDARVVGAAFGLVEDPLRQLVGVQLWHELGIVQVELVVPVLRHESRG